MSRPRTNVVVVLASGPNAGQSYGVDSSDFLIGNQPDCDVRLDADEIDGDRILRCHRGRDGWQVEAIDNATFFVGQRRAGKSTELRSGDVIRMSHNGPDFQFYLQVAGSPLQPIVAQYLPSANVSESVDPSPEPNESDGFTLGEPAPRTAARKTQVVGGTSTDGSVRSTQRVGNDGRNRDASNGSDSVAASDVWHGDRSKNRTVFILISIIVGAALGLGIVAVLVTIKMRFF